MNGAEQHNLTPSDLIYLFVDGEASDIERTLLFNALVGNAELQGELADAIRINSAAQQEMFETLPPASVTRALFRRVEALSGDGTAAIPAAAGLAGVAERGLAPDRSPASSGVDQPKRNRRLLPALLPLLTGALGMVLGLLLSGGEGVPAIDQGARIAAGSSVNLPSRDGDQVIISEGASTGTLNGNLRISGEIADNASPSLQSRGPVQRSASRSVRTDQYDNETRSVQRQPRGAQGASSERVASASERKVLDDAFENSIIEDQVDEKSAEGDGSINPRRSFEDLAVTTPHFTLRRPAIRLEEKDRLDRSLFPTSDREEPRPEDDDVELSFFMRGGNEMGFYPERVGQDQAARENLQNLAIGGYYHLDRMHAIGIQGGRDYHPFYVSSSGGSSTMLDLGSGSSAVNQPAILSQVGGGGAGGNALTGFAEHGGDEESIDLLNNSKNLPVTNVRSETLSTGSTDTAGRLLISTLDPTIEWIGLGYRFSPPGLDRLGLIRPEFQAAIGMSSVGPVGRASLGLAWKPGTRVSLSAGVEGTGVVYRLDGEVYSSRRIGVVYGVEVGW